MHVLTLTPFFPSVKNDARGCFIAEPLGRTERFDVKNSVFAVQPIYRSRAHSRRDAPRAQWIRYPALPGGVGLPSAGALLYTTLVPRIRDLHRLDPVNIIHAHGALPCGHAAALLQRELGIPFMVTVHGLDAFSTNQVKGRAGGWCQRVSRMVYGAARRVVCISERVCDEAVKGSLTPVRTAVIYNGADPHLFIPSQDATS